MADDSIDPIREMKPAAPVTPGGRKSAGAPSHQGRITGRVVAVHKKSGHRESGHVLDTSVGAQEHSELVIRVEDRDLSDLVGKQVSVQFLG